MPSMKATSLMEPTPTMKNMFRLLLVTLCVMPISALAQLANPPIYIETIVHHSDYGEPGHNLAGYVTYKVYVQFTAANNYLTSIFAIEGNGAQMADCQQDNDSSVVFTFDCDVFQHELGGSLGSSQFCFPGQPPTSIYDSYITIGQQCQSDVNFDQTGTLGDPNCIWESSFEGVNPADFFEPGNFFWDENSIYSIPTGLFPSLSQCDGNFRVLIGQFTTCGDMQGSINFQYETPNGVTNNQAFDVPIIGIHPCLNDPMDNTADVTLPCFSNELAEVALGTGGNDSVYYYMFNSLNELVASDSLVNGGFNATNLPEEDYIIYMRDKAGCRDTSDVISIVFPPAFEFDAVLVTDEECFGELNGSIELVCNGGTGVIDIIDQNGTGYSCGQIVDGLACTTLTFTATDQNSCSVGQTITVACPDELQFNPTITDILCNGYDDGVIQGTINGGSGPLTIEWTFNGNPYETDEQQAPVSVNLTGLDGGNYFVNIVDTNQCVLQGLYSVFEPEAINIDLTVTPATCYNYCDGTVINNSTGGTAPLTMTAEDSTGLGVSTDALCAGLNVVFIEDLNGCIVTDTILVEQPTQITYSADTTATTCFGSCDGAMAINEVEGSFGGFTYAITPNTVTCQGSCSGNSAEFTEACAGNYVVTITDQNNCFVDVNFTIDEPDALEFTTTVTNVTCFTFGDGTVTVDEVIGGTEPFEISLNDTEYLPWPDSAGYINLVPGAYILAVRDSNDCSATQNFDITEPELLTITLDTTIACSCGGICDGLLQYTPQGGTPNYQYLLTPGDVFGPGFGVVNGLCAGDYEIFLIDANECRDSVEFTITEPDPLTIEVLLDAPTCTGMNDGSAEITVGGGTGELSFYVEPDDYEPEVIDSVTFGLSELIEDTLYFELADENGCRIYDTLGIVPDIITDMILTMTQTPETCWNALDGTATVAVQNGNPPLSYEWDDNLLQTTATAMGLAPNAEYMVRVTDDIGCNLTASIFVEANIGCFFIATAITPNGDGVNDSWVLGGFEYYPECKVNVFNRWGQTVFSSTGYTAQWDGRFNGQLLPIADYYFTIDYADDKEVIMGTVTIKY